MSRLAHRSMWYWSELGSSSRHLSSKRTWKHRKGYRPRMGPPRTFGRSNQIASGSCPDARESWTTARTTNGKCDDRDATSNVGDANWCSDGDHYATSNEPQFSQLLPLAPHSAHESQCSVPSHLRLDLKRYLWLQSRQRARSATAILSWSSSPLFSVSWITPFGWDPAR